jgi:hypothetical protein
LRIIKHRANSINDLISIPRYLGVEIDVRTFGLELIVSHDPFAPGVIFSQWLENYSHNFLIVNVKEDGLEKFVLDLLEKHQINDFFFLDQPIPSLYKSSKLWPDFCCARVSDIEPVESALNLSVGWFWFDSITGDWSYLKNAFEKISGLTVKKCLVSPELHRKNSESELLALKDRIKDLGIIFDAVCTKYPEKWKQI